MRKLLYKNIINSRIILLTFLTFTLTNATACNTHDQKFEGYQIKFDYEKHPKEREVAFQFYTKNYKGFSAENPLEKNQIGIELYDINGDGYDEILTYIQNSAYCGSAGCSFEILKKDENLTEYVPVLWNNPKDSTRVRLTVHENILILNSRVGKVHDILFNNNMIWKWQGTHYDLEKNNKN